MDFIFQARFRKYFILIVAIFCCGTIGLMLIEDYSFLDAFYMTLITITTIGYQEVQPLGTEGRIFMSLMIIGSFGTFAFAVSGLTNYFFSGEYRKDLRVKKTRDQLEKVMGHTIVCGYGRVGQQATETLRQHGKSVVVIEKHIVRADIEHAADVIFIQGDATIDEVLQQAEISKAKSLVACTPSDSDNLFIVVSAKALNSKIELISRASDPGAMKKIKNAGASHVIMPDTVGGQHMANLVVQPDLTEFVEKISVLSNDAINLREINFDALPNDYRNKSIGELNAMEVTGCMIIGYKNAKGDFIVNPDKSIKVESGSKLFVLGSDDQIRRLGAILLH
ncbi:MAG: potassium channel protein [Flavobacteriales bacterium]|nr:potassium channel protein [Flavobacteriales bacterium]